MKRILINATQQEELRVAIVDGQKLYNLDIEVPSKEQKKSSIFKGKVTRVEPSLEACFVEYGSERHGFLPFKEISKSYWSEAALKSDKRPSIKDAIKSGQEVVVQVEKEERGNKGAALTTKVSLAGRYSVLMPTEARAGGVSRRIEGEDRAQVRDAFANVNKPENMGAIVRTAGVGRSTEELQWDLDYLTTLWEAISKAAKEKSAPFLIYHDSSVIIRALRDHYDKDIGQILIDKPEVFQQAEDFVRQVMPHNLHKLKLYDEATPLFSRFQIESQIESAFQREVTLPSGGAIVIDHTEALTSIDINSGRATKGSDIEDTALNTNLEAASEVARQLRLRDLGGLFVIDFIDMVVSKNQRAVENRLRDELKVDRARVRTSRISRFGLLELSRQRLRPSLGESSQEVCRVCEGHGTVRSAESLSLSILRLLGEEAAKDHTGTILAHLPVDVATFLLNEKRADIAEMEKLQKVRIVLVPDQNYERPHYLLERLKDSEKEHAGVNANSYDLVEKKEPEVFTSQDRVQPLSAQAAVQSVKIEGFAPPPQQAQVNQPAVAPEQAGLFVKLWKGLFSTGTPTKETTEEKKTPQKSQQRRPQQNRGRHNNNQRGRGNQNRRGNQQNNQRNNQQNNQQNKSQQRKPQQQNAKQNTGNQAQPKKEDQSQNKTTDQQQGSQQQAGNSNNKTGGNPRRRNNRRRGPRGGRRDNRNNDQQAQQNQAGNQNQPVQQNQPDNQNQQGVAKGSEQKSSASSAPQGNQKSSTEAKPETNGNVKPQSAAKPQANSKPQDAKPKEPSQPKADPKPQAVSKPQAPAKPQPTSKPTAEAKPAASTAQPTSKPTASTAQPSSKPAAETKPAASTPKPKPKPAETPKPAAAAKPESSSSGDSGNAS